MPQYKCIKCETLANSKCVNLRNVFPRHDDLSVTLVGNMIDVADGEVSVRLEHLDMFVSMYYGLSAEDKVKAVCVHRWQIVPGTGECLGGCCK